MKTAQYPRQASIKPRTLDDRHALPLRSFAAKARSHWLGVVVAVTSLSTTTSIHADCVAEWNAITVQATITAGRPGPTSVFDIATVHAAIYDAVQAIEKRFEPYYVTIPGASGSPDAAAVKAAHDVLVNRFPAQSAALAASYQQSLSKHGVSESDPGVAVGAAAAAGIIALRKSDGAFPDPAPAPFIGGTAPGMWRPTPPGNLPMLAPWMGSVVPFTLTRPAKFGAAPPPALSSAEYAKDYDEVKAIGALNSTTRTPEQTDVAHFYAGNTVVMWNRVLREMDEAHGHHIADSARLFALATMATADCLIASWNDKNRYVLWRPITAIQEGENDGNAATAGDPNWVSLITNPNYPDYTSGAVNFATAATRTLERFFGTDRMPFSITTTNINPTSQDTRTYARFSDAAEDVVNARVYSGIHFRFADEAARTEGRQVADWAFGNFMRPLTGDTAATSQLANISTRGVVQTGDNVIIGGFILTGATEATVIVRAIGPSLPVAGKLEDPSLELFDGNGTSIASNNNWADTQAAEITATGIPPTDAREAAIVRTLAPGEYTAVLRGVNDTTGVALVEVYSLH
jgi:hypothetical protein